MRLTRALPVLAITGLVTLHFTLARIGTFPLTPALIVAVVFVASTYTPRLPRRTIVLVVLVLLIPWINVWQVFLANAHVEFIETYLLWATTGTIVVVAATARLSRHPVDVAPIAFWSLTIVSSFSILQFAAAALWDSYALFNPWGERQYLYQLDYAGFAQIRAAGFYLEPSYNALVAFVLLSILVIQRHRVVSATALALATVLASRSLAGLLALALFGLALFVLTRRSRRTTRRAIGSISLLAVAVGTLLTQYAARLASLWVQGSSANARVVAPLPVAAGIVGDYPTGLALGRMLEFTSGFDSLHNQVLHNGLYVLVVYLGWMTVPVLIYLSFVLLRAGNGQSRLVLGVAIMLALGFTGSILTPEFALLLLLLIYAHRTRTRHAA
jgi:putative colanic acid polymerase